MYVRRDEVRCETCDHYFALRPDEGITRNNVPISRGWCRINPPTARYDEESFKSDYAIFPMVKSTWECGKYQPDEDSINWNRQIEKEARGK